MSPAERPISWEMRAPLPPDVEPSSPLRLDARLRWWVDGGEITHERTRAALIAGLRQDARGYYARLGPSPAWRSVEVEDAPLGVVALTDDGRTARLTDGRAIEILPEKLAYGPGEGRLRLELWPAENGAAAGDAGVWARFLPTPYHELLLRAEERENGLALPWGPGGAWVPIRTLA